MEVDAVVDIDIGLRSLRPAEPRLHVCTYACEILVACRDMYCYVVLHVGDVRNLRSTCTNGLHGELHVACQW